MKKLILVAAMMLATIPSCTIFQKQQTPSSRDPQQTLEQNVDEKVQRTFTNLMNAASDGERSQQVAHFLTNQRDFFYIAQGLLNHFDEELAKLYHLKTERYALTAQDKMAFAKASFQMRIAWEFSERNEHELLGIYELALTHANNRSSEYNRACTWIVKNITKWLDKGWKNGDQSAIISLAQNFDDINEEYSAQLKSQGKTSVLIPSYKQYSGASSAVRDQAYRQSIRYSDDRKKSLFDSFIAKKWLEFSERRAGSEASDLQIWNDEVVRKPQALDTLYPDAGGAGQVTGNRFPQNTWAVTFDDGPHPVHTPGMFAILQQNQMIGTFFWLSQNILKYPQLVTQAGQMGFNRASHTFSHPNLPTLNQAGWNHEINDALDVFAAQVGQPATFFRCPYGACGGTGSVIRQMIAKRNALHIFWNVDSLDWQDKNPQSVFERAKKQMEILNHGIVLFHDIHPQSVEAFKLLTAYIKTKGFKVRALPDIISEVRGSAYASP